MSKNNSVKSELDNVDVLRESGAADVTAQQTVTQETAADTGSDKTTVLTDMAIKQEELSKLQDAANELEELDDDDFNDEEFETKTRLEKGVPTGLKIRREQFPLKNGKKGWGYFVGCIINGHKQKLFIKFKDKDVTGYNLLEAVYSEAVQFELVVEYYRNKDNNNNVKSGYNYYCKFIDCNGEPFYLKMYPKTESDGAGIMMYLQFNGILLAK